jgi:hypothetical protein
VTGDALRQRKRQHLTRLWLLLGGAFVLSAGAAFLLVTAGELASARGILGALVALVAVALAGTAGVINHRFPDPADRHRYPPGQLGLGRFLVWVLAALSVGPVFIALTVVDWS